MQHEIAHRVHPEQLHQIIGIDDISLGLAHLAVPLEKPGMAEHLLGQWKPQCHKENRPVNGVEADDILSD